MIKRRGWLPRRAGTPGALLRSNFCFCRFGDLSGVGLLRFFAGLLSLSFPAVPDARTSAGAGDSECDMDPVFCWWLTDPLKLLAA